MNNDTMVFSITAYGKSVTIETHDELDIFEVLENFRVLATAIGYEPETWKTGVIELGEAYTDEEQREIDKNLRDYGNYTAGANYTNEITNWGPVDASHNC